MSNDPTLKRVLDLVNEIPGLLNTTLSDYFDSAPLNGNEEAALREFGDMTLHEFMLWWLQNGDEEGGALQWLEQIERRPLNHLTALSQIYAATQSPEALPA